MKTNFWGHFPDVRVGSWFYWVGAAVEKPTCYVHAIYHSPQQFTLFTYSRNLDYKIQGERCHYVLLNPVTAKSLGFLPGTREPLT